MIRALAVLLALAGPAVADPFQDAVDAWVAGDDQAAFPALAELATGGDTRAMLFLGAIEQRPWVTAWLTGLDRKVRIALIRQPGGLSGKSWLPAIPQGDPQQGFADALLRAKEGDPGPLLAQGQVFAAIPALGTALNQDPRLLSQMVAGVALPPQGQTLVWIAALAALRWTGDADPQNAQVWAAQVATSADAPPDSAGRMFALHLGYDHPIFAGVSDEDRAVSAIVTRGLPPGGEPAPPAIVARAAAILMAAPETAAQRALCAPCPDVPACTLDLCGRTGGWLSILISQTPLDALVQPDLFAASHRQQMEILFAARLDDARAPLDSFVGGALAP